MSENLFCKIFVLAAVSREVLVRFVTDQVNGKANGHSIECEWGVVDVLNNDDADCSRAAGPDGFLHFPYLIETEPNPDCDGGRFVGNVIAFFFSLGASRYGAVAACHFESEL